MIELALCAQRDDLNGIYLSPSYTNPQVWFGLIYVRYGTYSGAAFRFIMLLGETDYDHQNVNFPIHRASNSRMQHVNTKVDSNRFSSSESNQTDKTESSKTDDVSSEKSKSVVSDSNLRDEDFWRLPRIYFYSPTKPYHPHVDPITGKLNLDWYFRSWDEKRHHIWHCLKCLRHLFYNRLSKSDLNPNEKVHTETPNDLSAPSKTPKTLLNVTAAELYKSQPEEYLFAVQNNIERQKSELNTCTTLTDDIFEPNYSDMDKSLYVVSQNKMMESGKFQKLAGWQAQNAQTSGHSFIKAGTIKPFSK